MHVGVIGLGIMGQAMAARLLAAGHAVRVYNRTGEKAEPLLEQGAVWEEAPAVVAARSEVVLSMVSDPAAVAQITRGPEGVLSGLAPESVHCDMSTVSPASAQAMAALYREHRRRFVQAPVLGSKRQIEAGTLLVFGGGEADAVAQCDLAWRAFSGRNWHFPTAEAAATTKLACNMLIAQMILGLGQSLLFAAKGGVEPALLLEILEASALGCPMYASKGKTLLERNFQANFFVRHLIKDLRLASQAGQETGTPLLSNALNLELLVAAAQQGWAEEDYSAVVKVLEQLAGRELAAPAETPEVSHAG
jgi:3-hydroxyisobutyrate dehydrogenase-like beta-hydroxyacid dehydrogenase